MPAPGGKLCKAHKGNGQGPPLMCEVSPRTPKTGSFFDTAGEDAMGVAVTQTGAGGFKPVVKRSVALCSHCERTVSCTHGATVVCCTHSMLDPRNRDMVEDVARKQVRRQDMCGCALRD